MRENRSCRHARNASFNENRGLYVRKVNVNPLSSFKFFNGLILVLLKAHDPAAPAATRMFFSKLGNRWHNVFFNYTKSEQQDWVCCQNNVCIKLRRRKTLLLDYLLIVHPSSLIEAHLSTLALVLTHDFE